MFSDLTGYTALNEAFDPEEVEQVMARIMREASRIIESHGGRVNQFVGDEVMALFGVPVARRDDARHAVRAALELHAAVDTIAAGLADRLGRRLSMHTGLQTGLVIARRSDSRSGDYTLTGDTVNTAARLRGLAEPGEVVVSPQTWQQVADFFDAQAGTAVEVKGKERPLQPYRILAERAVPHGGSRPLIGRAEELQQFEVLLQACVQRRRGRVVLVRGDPGLGKSRLVAEFVDHARERGLTCHVTAIADFGARTGHDAIRVLVQAWMGLAPDADEPSRAAAIALQFGAGTEGAQHQPFLYELLDVAPPTEVRALLSAIDAAVRQRSTLDALGFLLRAELEQGPALLLIEDVHWADAGTLSQLEPLLALAAHAPLLAVLTTRYAGDPTVGTWRSALHGLPLTSMDLQPLGRDDALRLAAGAASISDALLRSCVERAEGNPLFLEQLLLNAGDDGANHLPGSIQALIQARMDRLGSTDKAALQAAAVWGQRVPLTVVRHLVGDPHYDARALVEQFLVRLHGDELQFSHALIRDGAYGAMLHARRRQLHRSAAEWVLERDVALAAEHFERAEDARAAAAYLQASEQQSRQHRTTEALALVDRALALNDQADAAFGLRLARARLLLEIGHANAAIAAAGTAIDAARSGGERALGLIAMASGMRIVDRPADGLELLQEAQPLAEQAALVLDLSHLHELRGNLLFSLGRADECRQAHEQALALAREAGSAEAECAALGGIGDASYSRGRVVSGARLVQQCVDMAREQGFLKVEMAYLPMVSWSSYYMLQLPQALAVSARAIALASRVRNPRAEMMARAQVVMIDGCIRGNHVPAMAHVDRALELTQMMGSRRFEAITWFFRALLVMRGGDLAAARAHLETAFRMVEDGARTLAFMGAQLYGLKAMLADDASTLHEALAAGEALLSDGALSHNHFVFYDFAIQACIGNALWDDALRMCALLEAYTAAEPFPWADFITARGRALARHGQGGRSADLLAELRRLGALARERELNYYSRDIDDASVASGATAH
jgi:class 3 adenylate cyclase/tetratricopeptide (TPR) repeat protein